MSYGREESGATGVSGVAVYGLRELLDVCWTSSNSHVPTRLMTIMLNEVGCFASFPHLLSAAILPALPIVHKSRMELPGYSPRLLFELLLSLTALFVLAAELHQQRFGSLFTFRTFSRTFLALRPSLSPLFGHLFVAEGP